jgi:hypothetical protein
VTAFFKSYQRFKFSIASVIEVVSFGQPLIATESVEIRGLLEDKIDI